MLFSCWIFTTCACEHCFTCFISFNIHGSGLRWPALCVSISPAPEDSKPDAFFPPSLAARELFWPRRHRKICPGGPWRYFLFLEGRWAVWGIFFLSFSHLLSLLPAWNLNYKVWEWDIWNHCCHFKSRRPRGPAHFPSGSSWGLQPNHHEHGQSCLILEAKRGRAWSVLGWEKTARVAHEPLTFSSRFFLHEQMISSWTEPRLAGSSVTWRHGHPDWWVYSIIILKFHKWLETDRKMNILRDIPDSRGQNPDSEWYRTKTSPVPWIKIFRFCLMLKRGCQLVLCFSPLRFLGLTWWSSD